MEVSLKEFGHKYKQYIGPGIFVILTLFIFLRVVLPLFTNISEERARLKEQEQRVQDLQETLANIQTINADNIQSKLSTAQDALPINKDIVLIYSTLVSVASKHDINVETFSVSVGEVYVQEGKQSTSQPTPPALDSKFPALSVSTEVSASDPSALFAFSKDLSAALPLSEVKTLITEESAGEYAINFFYKPLNSVQLSQQEFVKPLTEEEKEVLQTIQGFKANE